MAPLFTRVMSNGSALLRWVLYALINAEELEITAKGVDELSAKEQVQRRAAPARCGRQIMVSISALMPPGRRAPWLLSATIRRVFERNLGAGSKLGIARGINALWNAGGLLYVPPIR